MVDYYESEDLSRLARLYEDARDAIQKLEDELAKEKGGHDSYKRLFESLYQGVLELAGVSDTPEGRYGYVPALTKINRELTELRKGNAEKYRTAIEMYFFARDKAQSDKVEGYLKELGWGEEESNIYSSRKWSKTTGWGRYVATPEQACLIELERLLEEETAEK